MVLRGGASSLELRPMEPVVAGDQTTDLKEYLAVLRARKWTIILVTALVVGSALFFSYRQTPLYEGSARLLVKALPADSSRVIQLMQGPNLETEAEIVRSESVATLVIEDLELDVRPEELIAELEVEPAAELSQVLQISYTSPIPETARDVPNSFAANYIAHKRNQAREAQEVGLESIEKGINSVQDRLAAVTERISSLESEGEEALAATLETERSALIARLGVLQQRLDDFQTAQPIDLAGGEIIAPATLPSRPSSPDHIRNGLLAAFLGVALGIGVAFLKERLDDRFKGRMDIVRSLDAPVLASIPRLKVPKKKRHVLAINADPRGHSSEAYRGLRTGIEFISSQRGLKSILITSPSPGEGKTMTTANLAVTLAQAGRRTIIVSADLRRPTLEHYFGINGGLGLADWLDPSSDLPIESLLDDPGIPNLRVMPSGRIPANPAELLASPLLGELIEALEANSDIVLLDSPPVLAVADPLILASKIDGTVLILDADKTHRSAGVHARGELERVGATIIGSVLNSFDASGSPYYYEPYSYGYSDAQPEPISGNGGNPESRKRSFGFRR